MTTKAILTDIEGTTSSIAFVKETLFPYARQALPDWLAENRHDPVVRTEIAAVAAQIDKPESDLASITSQLVSWIDDDVKATPLKTLQGLLWKSGYENDDYRAHIYQDAIQNLQDWSLDGIPLYVYSSGSIAAQKLFFKHSMYGDVRNLFSGYFDTRIGAKNDANSYRKIAATIDTPASDILFLSDVEAELEAAQETGMSVVLLIREDDSDIDPDHVTYDVAKTFFEVASSIRS